MPHEIAEHRRDGLMAKATMIINESIRGKVRQDYVFEKLRRTFKEGQRFEENKILGSHAFQEVNNLVSTNRSLDDDAELTVSLGTLRELVSEVER